MNVGPIHSRLAPFMLRQSPLSHLVRWGSAFLLLSLCSCASVSVKETIQVRKNADVVLPAKIYVKHFEINDAGFEVDREGERLKDFKWETSERMARMLVRHLRRRLAPATIVSKSAPLPQENAWLVTGRFERVEQGSRALRTLVGFGAGATRMETAAFVYDLRKPDSAPFLVIRTEGGSNQMGGLAGTIFGFNPFLFGLNILTNLQHGLVWDSNRTSREITAAMSEYLYNQGVIADDEAYAAKRRGHFWGHLKPRPSPTPDPKQ